MWRTRETTGVLDGFVGADEIVRLDFQVVGRVCSCECVISGVTVLRVGAE